MDLTDPECGFERVLALVDQDLDGHHDHRAKASGDRRCNAPGRRDLRDGAGFPPPIDRDVQGDAHADEGAHERLRRGDGESQTGADRQPCPGT